jgi:predicted ATPase
LCRQIGTAAEFAVVLFQSWVFYYTRAIHSRALRLGEELHERMQGSDDPEARIVAHFPIGLSLMSMGRLQEAVPHFEKVVDFYRRFPGDRSWLRYGIDMSAGVHPYFGWTLWTLGYPATALKQLEGLVARLERLNHPFTTARSLVWCFNVSAACRDWPAAYQAADQAVRLSDEHGFAMTSLVCHICRGAARAALDPGAQTIVEMRDSLAGYKGLGGRVQLPNFLVLYAQTLMLSNDWDAAASALSEASAVIDETGERHLAAEIDRMKGELMVRSGRGDPEPHYLAALDVARKQDARMLELRAARDLARLWRDQGKPRAAHGVLAPVHGWFTEGFDLPDLAEAGTLLNELVLLAGN